jgi:hypothetical protein
MRLFVTLTSDSRKRRNQLLSELASAIDIESSDRSLRESIRVSIKPVKASTQS